MKLTIHAKITLLACLFVMSSAIHAEIYYYHNDHLGTPQIMTNSAQQVVWEAVRKPFGEVNKVVELIENNLGFPGQYHDAETGLYQNYFRNYDPSMGRYVESDPIGLDGGMNTYSYAINNPTNKSDSLGLKTCGSGWNEPFVPDNPFSFLFSSCCEGHDNCYGTCGTIKGHCDVNFYTCMLGKCSGYLVSEVTYACTRSARFYYYVVSSFGQSAYDAAQEKACPSCPKP